MGNLAAADTRVKRRPADSTAEQLVRLIRPQYYRNRLRGFHVHPIPLVCRLDNAASRTPYCACTLCNAVPSYSYAQCAVKPCIGGILKKPALVQAVLRLRKRLGDTQQQFANRLGMSIRAVANYEKDRRPDPRALSRLLKEAERMRDTDLADTFRAALKEEMASLYGPPSPQGFPVAPQNPTESAWVLALLVVLRSPKYHDRIAKLRPLLREPAEHLVPDFESTASQDAFLEDPNSPPEGRRALRAHLDDAAAFLQAIEQEFTRKKGSR